MLVQNLSKPLKNLKGKFDYHKAENTIIKYFFSKSVCYEQTAVKSEKCVNNSKYVEKDCKNKFFIQVGVESTYARKVMENSEKYSNTLATSFPSINSFCKDPLTVISKQWNSLNSSELLKFLESLSLLAFTDHEIINNVGYSELYEVLEQRCSEFSDKELHHFLKCLELWVPNHKNLIERHFATVIDEECMKRLGSWSINEILLTNDELLKLKLTKNTFASHSLHKIGQDFSQFNKENLIQFAYLMKINKKKVKVNLHSFEHFFEKSVDKLTVDEISIMSMALFKYEYLIKSKNLLLKVIHALENNIDRVNDISLATILKMLRYSVDLTIVQSYSNLLKLLVPQVHRLWTLTLTHTAHMQGRTLLHNEELISNILERYNSDISSARIKDIERILFTLYTFNYDPKKTPFYEKAYTELLKPHRSKEIESFPRSFVYSALYMLQANYYPEEIIKRIMQPDFINKTCENDVYKLDREYLVIDYCLKIEHPDYDGPRMRKDLLQFLVKRFGTFHKSSFKIKAGSPKISSADKFLFDVIHTCKQALGCGEFVHSDSILPHFMKNDIILCYNEKRKKFIPPGNILSNYELGTIKFAPKDGNKWYTLTLGHHNVLTRNSFQPTGVLAARFRHLQQVGYIPFIVSYNHWNNLFNANQKENYIRNLLNLV